MKICHLPWKHTGGWKMDKLIKFSFSIFGLGSDKERHPQLKFLMLSFDMVKQTRKDYQLPHRFFFPTSVKEKSIKTKH